MSDPDVERMSYDREDGRREWLRDIIANLPPVELLGLCGQQGSIPTAKLDGVLRFYRDKVYQALVGQHVVPPIEWEEPVWSELTGCWTLKGRTGDLTQATLMLYPDGFLRVSACPGYTLADLLPGEARLRAAARYKHQQQLVQTLRREVDHV